MKAKTASLCMVALLMAGLCMGGCGEEWEETCLTIEGNGTISQRIVEDFSKEHYELEELRTMTEEEIDTYCQESGEGGVELTRLKEKDGSVTMDITYQSVEDYNNFNGTKLIIESVEEAVQAENDGIHFLPNAFIKAKDSSTAEKAEVIKDTSLSIVIFDETVLYETNKKILYYSENVELMSDKCGRLKDSEAGPGYLIY